MPTRETAPCGALGWQHPADLSTSDVEPALCWICYCRDTVAKVENRATPKISRKLIFGLLRRCVAFQGHHGGPWSILDQTMWSLTSPLAKRISGSKQFRLSPQKGFCNSIVGKADIGKACRLYLGGRWHEPSAGPLKLPAGDNSAYIARWAAALAHERVRCRTTKRRIKISCRGIQGMTLCARSGRSLRVAFDPS